MAGDERGYWPSYVGELWDADPEGISESVSTVDSGIQISRVEVRATAEGGRGRWPFSTDELIVFVADVAAVGHSTSNSIGGARSHRFLLNNRECATVPYLARQLSVFRKLDY